VPKNEKLPLYVAFLAGGAAGFGFWGFWYPLDIIKTRMQTDATFPKDRKYRHTLDCILKTYKNEGLHAFGRVLHPVLLELFQSMLLYFLLLMLLRGLFLESEIR